MSFNINFNQPAITGAQASQDGGAGNLGYMKGGGGNSRHKEEANSIFDKPDTFEKSGQEKESFDNYIERMFLTLKLIIQKILKALKIR